MVIGAWPTGAAVSDVLSVKLTIILFRTNYLQIIFSATGSCCCSLLSMYSHCVNLTVVKMIYVLDNHITSQ